MRKTYPIILIGVSLVFIGLDRIDKFNRLRTKIITFFSPLQFMSTLFFNASKVRKENEYLKRKITHLSLENQILQRYKYENEELRNLLNFIKEKEYELIPAKIIGREIDPFPSVCVINKGRKDGVEKEMQVITYDGIYGKIIQVEENTAKVQTIFDYNFRVSGMNLRNEVHGIVYRGEGPYLALKYVPIGADIKIDDEIITSGMGSVFIKGLKVGKVKKISPDKTLLTYHILLQPACKIEKVENVFIIKEKKKRDTLIKETNLWEIKKKESSEYKHEVSTIRLQ